MAMFKRLYIGKSKQIQSLINLSRCYHDKISMEELVLARKKSDEEMVLEVDINNNEIGYCTRKESRNGKYFRASYIFVFNSQQQLYVQKRVKTKAYCPGYLDICAGGVVSKNDSSCTDNAYRELYEELGIDLLAHGLSLMYHGCIRHIQVWENIYSCIWDGEIKPEWKEMESVHLKTIDEIQNEYNYNDNGIKYCPDSICALHHYILSCEALQIQ